MIYKVFRPLIFKFNPEFMHVLALKWIRVFAPFYSFIYRHNKQSPIRLFNLEFPNKVGLAAGFDKNGEYVDALFSLGFGFIEVGTVTPKPQLGNPQPRLFRDDKNKLLINRMGFNNKGVDYLVNRLLCRKSTGIVGVNIGKNKSTPINNAVADYLYCLSRVYPVADYIVVNISSPNTPGLRSLQSAHYLRDLTTQLQHRRLTLTDLHHKKIPLLIKISVDLADKELYELVDVLIEQQMDGVIVANTSLDRSTIKTSKYADQTGGVSGQPLSKISAAMINKIQIHTKAKLPIIGVGGVMTPQDGVTKLQAGASLIQVYTGVIFSGTNLVAGLLASSIS